MAEPMRQFTQAGTTLFLTPPLINIFGEAGSKSKTFQAVLDGILEVHLECDQYVHKLVKKLA